MATMRLFRKLGYCILHICLCQSHSSVASNQMMSMVFAKLAAIHVIYKILIDNYDFSLINDIKYLITFST